MNTSPKRADAATFQVVVRKHADVIKTRVFPIGKTLCIGKHPFNDIHLDEQSSSSKVSSFHAALFWEADGTYTLQDLGSQNGTGLNGRRADYGRVSAGSVVGVGDFDLTIHVGDTQSASADSDIPIAISESDIEVTTTFSPLSLEAKDLSHFKHDPDALMLFYKLSRWASFSLSAREALQLILREVATTLRADRALIVELQPGGNTIQCLATFPVQENAIQLSRTMIDWVLAEKRALLTQDAMSDKRFQGRGHLAQSIEEQRVRSAICVPLEWDSQIKGLLYLDNPIRSGLFTERHQNLLAVVAHDLSSYLAFDSECNALREENLRLTSQVAPLAELIGVSPHTKSILKSIERVRNSEATVLLTGETGSGKDVVARAIHASSKRRNQPFIPVNCAAIPDQLVESELFGIEKGVATGVAARIGHFKNADGGTLFLDEIGDLPLTLQAKLLRVLEDKVIWPVGRRQPVPVDVRIVTATHRDLQSAIHENRFREDLYARVNLFTIEIPPLRERKEDIPLLCGYFLHKLRGSYGKKITRFSKSCVEALMKLEWPRNVRQLRNAVERAIILANENDPVLTEDLFDLKTDAGREPCSLSEMERHHIQKVLDYTNGNKQRAARILGISKETLYNKGEEYKLAGFGGKS